MHYATRLAATGALLVFLAVPVAAQPAPAAGGKGDPNELVCEKQKVLGSRLAAKRVCMTRAEWARQRDSDRELVQNSQLMVRQKNPCSLNGC